MLGLITRFLGPKVALVIAGVAVLAIITAYVQSVRLGAAQTERDAQKAEVTRLLAADEGKERTIQALQGSITAIRAEADEQGEAMLAASKALKAKQAKINAQAAALAAAEATEYAKPDCQAILVADIATVCPLHADGLRKRAARGLSGPSD